MIYKNVDGTLKLVTNIRKPRKLRRLEYILSSGTQWIDTGVIPNSNTRVEMRASLLDAANTAHLIYSNGSGSGTGRYGFMCESAVNRRLRFDFGGSMYSLPQKTLTNGLIFNFSIYKGMSVDGVAFKSNLTDTFSNTVPLTLFAPNYAGTIHVSDWSAKMRLYSCKIYQNNNQLVRDFIPCIYEDQCGLWDLQLRKFYPNKGSGNFIAGTPLDEPYEEIEKIIVPKNIDIPSGLEFYTYLLGDGLAYIDTGCMLNRNSTISIVLLLTEKINQDRFVGIQKMGGLCILMYSGDSGGNIKTFVNITTSSTYSALIKHNTDIHHYYLNDSSHKSYCDGTAKTTHTNIPATDDYVDTCYLFWANGADKGNQSTCRIYSCRVLEGSELKGDFHPCTYQGQPGVWDTVTKTFHGNSGNGAFSLGNKITNNLKEVSTSMPLYDPTVYKEPDGSEWIHIFHHNNPATNLFASTDSFMSQAHGSENKWFDVAYCYKLQKYEFLLKQSLTAGGTIYKYRWIQDINPMVAGFNDVPRSKVTYITSTGYTDPVTYGGLCRGISSTYLRANNGYGNNWWGAIGAWGLNSGYVPCWNEQPITTGCIDLYVRNPYKSVPLYLKKYFLSNSTIGSLIDTNLMITSELPFKFYIKFKHGETGRYCLLSNFYAGATAGIAIEINTSDKLKIWLSEDVDLSFSIDNTTENEVTLEYLTQNSWLLTYNGVSKSLTHSLPTQATPHTLKIFGDDRTSSEGVFNKTLTIYKTRIWQNNILTRDFSPALMGGRPGLYDKVNHKMYFNANSSGNFTVE